MTDNLPIPKPDRDAKGLFQPGNTFNPHTPALDDPEEVERTINNYFEECETHLLGSGSKIRRNGETFELQVYEPLTMMGLADALGLTRQALNTYKPGFHATKNKDMERVYSLIARARSAVARSHMAYSLTGVHEPKIAALVMQGDLNYHTKTENVNLNINKDMTDDELDASIARIMGIEV